MSLKPAVIGITGPFGSGKTTAASFFEKKGFIKITLSSFVENQLRDDGREITRRNLQDLANKWRSENSSSFLARKAMDYIRKKNLKELQLMALEIWVK